MEDNIDQSSERPEGLKRRFRIGWTLFLLGLVFPVFIPLVMMIDMPTKWKVTASAAMSVGIPELLWIAAAAVLGKEGFKAVRDRAFAFIKRYVLPEQVGRTRYRIGLVMFCLPLLFAWLAPYVSLYCTGSISYHLIFSIIGDVIFIASLFVLGGEFWDKLRALFTHSSQATCDLT